MNLLWKSDRNISFKNSQHKLHQGVPPRKTHIDKFLLLPLVLRPASLVLENNIIIPPPLDVEVWLVQQRIPQRNVLLLLLLLLLGTFSLFPLPLLDALPPDPLQLPLQFGLVIVAVVVAAIVVVVLFFVRVVRINVPCLLQYPPSFGFRVLLAISTCCDLQRAL
ncbi:hypothetical protein B0T18DRAFT_246601 [Schizothecium vesticola]|uniref:Uncharacterized protein n=1 Tax=Schizothecium vesticola TaxID=314040 RepID=A0AA40EH52_9PEZI|nr:hypothetical protein B0T18DRAFT_246601 [Schizothecium vesticola]